jgi:hypothetical protein
VWPSFVTLASHILGGQLGDDINMKTSLLALAMLLAIPAAARASQCQDDIAKIDAALAASSGITKEQRDQIEDMRSQAVQLCGAGNDQEGLDVIAEAKAMLNLQ